MEEYSKEQLWELYKELPEDLQKAIFSEEIGNAIREICLENDITDENQCALILKYTGYVFLGLLPPNELLNILEREIAMEKILAEKISKDINNKIFLNLKESIGGLYNIELKEEIEEEVKKIKKIDKYKEPIE